MEATYNISEVGKMIGRVSHTIRQWEAHDRLPAHLRSRRNERGWRYWTASQVEGIKEWIIIEDMSPGKAFRVKREK